MSGLVPSVEWLLYSAIRKDALLTSQIEGIRAALQRRVCSPAAADDVSHGQRLPNFANASSLPA
jgi:hypothetical protein